MTIRNTTQHYGWISIAMHWLMAVAVVALFAVGLWMEDLDYTHPWYKILPHWHKSVGVLLVCLLVARFIWRLSNPTPRAPQHHKRWEKIVAPIVHYCFYVLILLMFPSGYLITTAKGQGLDVFNWFTIPSFVQGIDNLEDLAGEIHELIAFTIIGLAVIHAAGALKHHFIDKDATLKRMLGIRAQSMRIER